MLHFLVCTSTTYPALAHEKPQVQTADLSYRGVRCIVVSDGKL
jgi:hypothetical protein